MNKLIIIGFISNYVCYLNVSREEAISRFIKENDWYTLDEVNNMTYEMEFKDSFGAYEVNEIED